MTQRLYYQDSFLREFDAQVLSVEPAPAPSGCAPDAQQWHVVLDRTAFYPTSGGQPHDTGKLAEVQALLLLATEAGHNYAGGAAGRRPPFR